MLYLIYRITSAIPPRLMIIIDNEQDAHTWVDRQSSPASHTIRQVEIGIEISD